MTGTGNEQKTVTNIYAALCVSLFLSFLPMMGAAALSAIMFLGVWIGAYILRAKAEAHSLVADHMTFIIRTIWIAGLFGLITTGIATAYILSVYDPSMILACADGIGDMEMTAIEAAIQPCMDEFVSANMRYFINGTIIAAGPLVIYLGYRIAKGLSRAVKGHRIGDVKSWF